MNDVLLGTSVAITLLLIARLIRNRLDAGLKADYDAIQRIAENADDPLMGVATGLESRGFVIDRIGEGTVSGYRSSTYLPIRYRLTLRVENYGPEAVR